MVKNAHFKNKNLQMWFRVEVEHNLFAGFALYDINAKVEDCYTGYQVDNFNKEMIDEAALFISRDIMEPEDWWLAYCYSNGKRKVRDYEDVPNFKTMNSCAIGLIDPKQRKKYVKNAVKVFEKELLQYLLQI